MNEHKKLTNEVGAPIADNEVSITAGSRGPVVMQDVWLMEKMAHFNREVIPERRMHAKEGTEKHRFLNPSLLIKHKIHQTPIFLVDFCVFSIDDSLF